VAPAVPAAPIAPIAPVAPAGPCGPVAPSLHAAMSVRASSGPMRDNEDTEIIFMRILLVG
jgi:hypothetical protein